MNRTLSRRSSHTTALCLVAAAALWLAGAASPRALGAEPELVLEKGDRIIFLGNTFSERLALFSYFETLLSARFPDYELTFRTLGWSADTLSLRPRPLNFGDLETHLTEQRSDVIFACFGMNESFEGPGGLAKFEADWRGFLKKMAASRFNGKTPPRVVMVSPIAHEDLGRPLPDPAEHNKSLALYTDRMRQLAAEHRAPFIDLFTPTREIMSRPSSPRLTFNGIHVHQYGDWVVAQLMAQALGIVPPGGMTKTLTAGSGEPVRFQFQQQAAVPPPAEASESTGPFDSRPRIVVQDLQPGRYSLKAGGRPVAEGSAGDWARGVRLSSGPLLEQAEQLRRVIVEKNHQFLYRWRAVNGEYIYGRRKEPFGVISFPPEMRQLDGIVADLDGKIWSLSKGLQDHTYELVPIGD